MIAGRLDLSPGVVNGLGYTFEHHDGSGYPNGVRGEEIPAVSHVVMIARDFEVIYRLGGREMVLDAAGKRRGRAYEPRVLDVFLAHAWEVLDPAEPAGWDAVIAADPDSRALSKSRLRAGLDCLADFSDIRNPYVHGYSRTVSDLAAKAAGVVGLDAGEQEAVEAAALVQELGMTAVPSAVVDKPGALTEGEWERVRLHPYFTERILARCAGLADIGALAAAHHERLDGTGYHRGSSGPQLSLAARLLAAAGAFSAMTSQRPWRPAMPGDTAAAALRELADSGACDAGAVEAVLAVAGEPAVSRRPRRPAGLTDREVEVLRLIARGHSNRRMAEQLVISVKTVGRHVENIYAKTGVSTRAGATMFALQHGLTVPDG
jgi:HD-GYP domain-containing protein (c-di-GMP phosphodiesterase class II)